MQRQAGRRYESFIAQTLRIEGWEVDETGRNGIHDHGIDLIASKEGVRRYVQCKGWSRDKFIHEDVVSQLLGSVAAIEGLDKVLTYLTNRVYQMVRSVLDSTHRH